MLTVYYIDAFAHNLFEGNPAAVIPLSKWLSDDMMQALASENNLSETAFFVESKGKYHIRWFTPVGEVRLCGHATLAAAYVLFNELGYRKETIRFESLSGELYVKRDGSEIVLDFPAQPPLKCDAPSELLEGLGVSPVEILKSEDYIVVLRHESEVRCMEPLFDKLHKVPLRGVIATAESSGYDFVARFFGPKLGVNEDPVTGSAYTQLAPYWGKILGKTCMSARQVSSRGGDVGCKIVGGRVLISGGAVKYMKGRIIQDCIES
ncbi:MAG: isomerase [Rhodospirillaceae bacterium]|nr:isomerase [Rhodospirillaceae bacterium]|tara:strand:+ start:192 stop:983 length:792 start_codon:yes stop_codon:yes gene_type:complete